VREYQESKSIRKSKNFIYTLLDFNLQKGNNCIKIDDFYNSLEKFYKDNRQRPKEISNFISELKLLKKMIEESKKRKSL
jgi:hypothetical protein